MECLNLEDEGSVSLLYGMLGTVNPTTLCHIPEDPDLQIYFYFTLLNCCMDNMLIVYMYKELG